MTPPTRHQQQQKIDKRKLFSTYRKQKDRLKRMAYELAAICGVQVAVISINPSGRADSWPEDSDEVLRIFDKYVDLHDSERETGVEPLEGEPSTLPTSTSPSPPRSRPQLLRMNARMLEYVEKRIRLLKAQERRLELFKNSAALEVNRGPAAEAAVGSPRPPAPQLRLGVDSGLCVTFGGCSVPRPSWEVEPWQHRHQFCEELVVCN